MPAFLRQHKSLLSGPLATDRNPQLTMDFMFTSLRVACTAMRTPDGFAKPFPIPDVLVDVPVSEWPYPGPDFLRYAWYEPGALDTFTAVTIFVIRVNVLCLELRSLALMYPDASPGNDDPSLATAHVIGQYVSLMMDMCVRGAAILDVVSDNNPSIVSDQELFAMPGGGGDDSPTAAAAGVTAAEVMRFLDVFTDDGDVNELPSHEMPPTPFSMPDIFNVLIIYNNSPTDPSSRSFVMVPPKPGATHPSAYTDIPKPRGAGDTETPDGGKPRAHRGRKSPHWSRGANMVDISENSVVRLFTKTKSVRCARRSTSVMIGNRVAGLYDGIIKQAPMPGPLPPSTARRPTFGASRTGSGRAKASSRRGSSKQEGGREGTLRLLAAAMYMTFSGHAWTRVSNRGTFRLRRAADALFCAPSNLNFFLRWIKLSTPAKATSENLVITALIELMAAYDGVIPCVSHAMTRDHRNHVVRASAVRAMDTMRQVFATRRWDIMVCLSPVFAAALSTTHYRMGIPPFLRPVVSPIDIVGKALQRACSKDISASSGIMPGTEFVVVDGHRIPRGVYDIVLVRMMMSGQRNAPWDPEDVAEKNMTKKIQAEEAAAALAARRQAAAAALGGGRDGYPTEDEEDDDEDDGGSQFSSGTGLSRAALSAMGLSVMEDSEDSDDEDDDSDEDDDGTSAGTRARKKKQSPFGGDASTAAAVALDGVSAWEVGSVFGGGGSNVLGLSHGGSSILTNLRKLLDGNGSVKIQKHAVTGNTTRAVAQCTRFGSSEARQTLASLVDALAVPGITPDVLVAVFAFLLRSIRRQTFRTKTAPYRPFTPEEEEELAEEHKEAADDDTRNVQAFKDFVTTVHALQTLSRPASMFLQDRVASMTGHGVSTTLTLLFAMDRASTIFLRPVPDYVADAQEAAVKRAFAANGVEPHTAFHVHACTSCMKIRSYCVTTRQSTFRHRLASGSIRVFRNMCPGCYGIRLPPDVPEDVAPLGPAATDGYASVDCTVCNGVGSMLVCARRVMSPSASKNSMNRCQANIKTYNIRGAVLHFDNETYTTCVECGSLFCHVTHDFTCHACIADRVVGPEAVVAAMTPDQLQVALRHGDNLGMPDSIFPRFCCFCGNGCTASGSFKPVGLWVLLPTTTPRTVDVGGPTPAVLGHVRVWRWVCSSHRDFIFDDILRRTSLPPTGHQLMSLVAEQRTRAMSNAQGILTSAMRNRRPVEGSSAAATLAAITSNGTGKWRGPAESAGMTPGAAIRVWQTVRPPPKTTVLQPRMLYILRSTAQLRKYDHATLDTLFQDAAPLFSVAAVRMACDSRLLSGDPRAFLDQNGVDVTRSVAFWSAKKTRSTQSHGGATWIVALENDPTFVGVPPPVTTKPSVKTKTKTKKWTAPAKAKTKTKKRTAAPKPATPVNGKKKKKRRVTITLP